MICIFLFGPSAQQAHGPRRVVLPPSGVPDNHLPPNNRQVTAAASTVGWPSQHCKETRLFA